MLEIGRPTSESSVNTFSIKEDLSNFGVVKIILNSRELCVDPEEDALLITGSDKCFVNRKWV